MTKAKLMKLVADMVDTLGQYAPMNCIYELLKEAGFKRKFIEETYGVTYDKES